ncbi:hypothetical protein SAMN05444166_0902 [Singulisphaera sp. GP187]|nr:hypothetical protein SAMN05444166_0902 [Singulisphaera sp. GP187]
MNAAEFLKRKLAKNDVDAWWFYAISSAIGFP